MIEPGPTPAPDWNRLYATAAAQEGAFTTRQAAEAGYSSQLLQKHLRAGRVVRTCRGVYRLVHFPAGEHEDLVIVWLWSEHAGVFSHATALALHGLSDALPARMHLSLPRAWRTRRLRVPADVVLHHADVAPEERAWFGPVPATSAARSLADCARDGFPPDLLRQAAHAALRRGLVTEAELGAVEDALRPFGGLGA